MKKHSVTMVILLILTLSFMGVVSASENVTDCAMPESYQCDAPIEVTEDVELSNENLESTVSVSTDCEEDCDNVSVDELISYSLESEEEIAVSLDDGEISDDCIPTVCGESQFEAAECDGFKEALMVSFECPCNDSEGVFVLSGDEFGCIISIAPGGEIHPTAFDSNLEYGDNYKLGYDVTTANGELLDFESADEVLVIANAVIAKINNLTVRDVLNIMVDSSNGYVSYGKSNLLTWSSRNTNSEYIAFFIKRGGSLFVALFNEDMDYVHVGNASLKISASLWRELQDSIGENDVCVCFVAASSWANGVSGNVLNPAMDGGENIIQTLKFNLPRKESGLPLEDASYDVLGVPGITDDAFIWSDNNAPGKMACISDIMVKESVTQSVRWTSASQTGMLIALSFDESKIDMFREKTDLSPDVSANDSLKYQRSSNPTSAGDILAKSENLKQVLSEAQNEDVLSDESAYETDNSKELDMSTPEQLREIGVDAGEKAVAYFKSKGIDIQTNNENLYLLTSAGHVKINGMDTYIVFDGLNEGLGFKLSEKSLLPMHTSLWKDLVFYFFWIDSTSKNIISYGLRYSPEDNALVVVDASAQQNEYADYILSLYDEHSNGDDWYYNGYHCRYWDVIDGEVLSSNISANNSLVNKTLNSTKLENRSDNASNVTAEAKFDNVTKRPGEDKASSSPYNILYTLGSIFIVCAIFFTGYSKP